MEYRKKTDRADFIIIFSLIFVLCPISPFYAKDTKKAEIVPVLPVKEVKAETDKNVTESDKSQNVEPGKEAPGIYDYEKPVVEEESYTWLILKTIIILGLLVCGFYYFFKFVTKKTGIHALGHDVIKVLSIVPVGQNKFLQVVDIAGRVLVLGVTDASINIITEVEGRDEIDRIRLLSSKSVPVQPGGFQQYITKQVVRFINRSFNRPSAEGDSGHTVEGSSPDRMDYLKKQKDRLKGLNGNDDEK